MFKNQDWAKEYKKIDMFAVKLNEQGGFNVKSFNSVSNIALLPSHKMQKAAFKKYQ